MPAHQRWEDTWICWLVSLASTSPSTHGPSPSRTPAAHVEPVANRAAVDVGDSPVLGEVDNPRVVFRGDRDGLRAGMIRKMEDDILSSDLTIDQIMLGYNVAFVKFTEYVTIRRSPDDEYFEYVGVSVISLEFNEEGLITHIRRHND